MYLLRVTLPFKKYVVGSTSFLPDIQKLRQMENAECLRTDSSILGDEKINLKEKSKDQLTAACSINQCTVTLEFTSTVTRS